MASEPQRCNNDNDCNAPQVFYQSNAGHFRACMNGICGTFPLDESRPSVMTIVVITLGSVAFVALCILAWLYYLRHRHKDGHGHGKD